MDQMLSFSFQTSQRPGWTLASFWPQPSEPGLDGRRIFGSGLLGGRLLGPGGDGISQTRAQTSDPGSGRSGLGHSADLSGLDRRLLGNLGHDVATLRFCSGSTLSTETLYNIICDCFANKT